MAAVGGEPDVKDHASHIGISCGHEPDLCADLASSAIPLMKESSFEVLKRCRKSYEISQISAEAPEIVDSMFDAPELVSSSLVQGA